MAQAASPLVGIVMGSKSDWEQMSAATEVLTEFKVPHEVRVLSAHRTPDLTLDYAASAAERGLQVMIAGAGGAAHLPGVIAAKTILPVIGVPMTDDGAKRDRFAAVDRADAAWRAGGDDGDWQVRRRQCGPVCSGDSRARPH